MPSSKLSRSTYVVNIPEVTNFSSDFVYNYYTFDERTVSINDRNSSLAPRYVSLSWSPLSKFENYSYVLGKESTQELLAKIVSEDDTFSKFYYSRNFSEVTDIQRGAADLNTYFLFEDLAKFYSIAVTKKRLLELIAKTITGDAKSKDAAKKSLDDDIKNIHDQYDALSDLPSQILGLQVVDAEGVTVDKENLFKTLTSSLSLNVKINKLVGQDVLSNSEIGKNELDILVNFKFKSDTDQDVSLLASELKRTSGTEKIDSFPRIKGYIVRRYRYGAKGDLTEEFVKYLNDPSLNSYNDSGVLYGGKYVYSINVVAEIDIFAVNQQNDQPEILTVNIVSRSVFTDASCFEFKSPPPPADIKFNFDYVKKNVIITWDFPVNPQSDIKQFQIFRRQSLDEPFELIAQYGFDRSTTSFKSKSILSSELGLATTTDNFENKRFLTGEIVDANNISAMRSDLKHLVQDLDLPIYTHHDKDFIVDSEFFETTSYIYAMCSVDAHGMISNYSSQYKVTYDFFKNRIVSELICDEGSPRTYPNMNLRSDTFKDAINTVGMKLRGLDIYFSPDYYDVLDEKGTNFKIVNIQFPDKQKQTEKPFYQLQLINLDNQKTKVLKINIEQPPPPPQDIITIIESAPDEVEVMNFIEQIEDNSGGG